MLVIPAEIESLLYLKGNFCITNLFKKYMPNCTLPFFLVPQ